ncbi:MAG: Tim44-like domain-containing protein [Pseudomonadota bacterium]
MKRPVAFILTLFLGLSLSLAPIGETEAARLGGGKSFGGKPSYGNKYRRPFSRPTKPTAQQRQASAQNQAARAAMAKRGGLMGMLGGLALGGLLGALLFGGAFEGLSFIDFLVFGLIAFMLFKMFGARKAAGTRHAYGAARNAYGDREPGFSDRRETFEERSETARFDTDILFKKGNRPAEDSDATFETKDFNNPVIPAGFDEAAFLGGAKSAYRQLQAAWDNGDLAELRGLTTDKVFGELQGQLHARDGDNRTELLKVDAQLLEVREVGSEIEAAVLFDVIMREDAGQRADQVREIWHFVRPLNSHQPTWYLDGIQQLAD